ncbi:peptidase inhibitor family I36 protein [Streptomyces sp. NPDC060184]|uniref:peptidase inhibitor family I36 protein n=1 Tax=Streptomyces sp. NPDC060184 TaxID=3347064 RepID=UPI00365973FA
MNLGRRGVRALAACAAVVGILGVETVGASSATASYSECPDDEFCMWQHVEYEGLFVYSSEPQPNVHDFNDRASSFWNRTDGWIAVYGDSNYGNSSSPEKNYCWSIAPGASSANIGYVTEGGVRVETEANDSVSSFRPGVCEAPYRVFY